MQRYTRIVTALAVIAGMGLPASASDFCATPEQTKQVRAFYATNPGTMPPVAATRLGLPEAIVLSALEPEQAASAAGSHFAEIWTAIGEWKEATFLIMKGANVFEIRSAVGKGTPSTKSQYYNIEYTHPLRGHLRPDLYASLYAVSLPVKDKVGPRGVLFYDAEGASVFGAFISGDGPPPEAAELAKFDQLMALIRSKPAVCARE